MHNYWEFAISVEFKREWIGERPGREWVTAKPHWIEQQTELISAVDPPL